jgi:death-on-curing protein
VTATRQQWVWIDPALIHAVHDEQLAEHGGGAGVRDTNLLASALARPEQLAHYGTPDAADLAASYGYGISRNHPFVDGNKRTAFVAVELFLVLNGFGLEASDADCVLNMLSVAAGDIDEPAFANWIRAHIQARA